ncbi:hypothetical protein BUALT_Bualt07G0084100 [Buddleja alternifolia]|uniref:Uncharacterized protein n=1 Tax=Buddleja alternifolia TaxID=168488 RepID=A0AAV6XK24_9LAMI|nr:hypothetical protein BUALT_Bualt07G0084100 [Buddleja alternifolia]
MFPDDHHRHREVNVHHHKSKTAIAIVKSMQMNTITQTGEYEIKWLEINLGSIILRYFAPPYKLYVTLKEDEDVVNTCRLHKRLKLPILDMSSKVSQLNPEAKTTIMEGNTLGPLSWGTIGTSEEPHAVQIWLRNTLVVQNYLM